MVVAQPRSDSPRAFAPFRPLDVAFSALIGTDLD